MKSRVQRLAEWGLSLGIALIVVGMILIPMQAYAGYGYALPLPCAAGCDSGCGRITDQTICVLADNSFCTNDGEQSGLCNGCRCRPKPNTLICYCV